MLDTPWMNYLREFNLLSVFVRLTLSVFLSGLVGYERERKGQPAGLRTHMLVCLGSALAILTNTFVAQMYNLIDSTRIAAQVVSGIGFLGAGAIVVTGQFQRQVKGLTTAAGLWASACMGLAIGAGFYEGAVLGFVLMIIIIAVLHNLDERIHDNKRAIQLYAEFMNAKCMLTFIKELRRIECVINSTEIVSNAIAGGEGASAFFVVRYPAKTMTEADFLSRTSQIEGVVLVEPL